MKLETKEGSLLLPKRLEIPLNHLWQDLLSLALVQGLEAADAASLEPLHKVADERGRITRDILIPRTDATIGTGRERLRRIHLLLRNARQLCAEARQGRVLRWANEAMEHVDHFQRAQVQQQEDRQLD